jgi:hypothetical protein
MMQWSKIWILTLFLLITACQFLSPSFELKEEDKLQQSIIHALEIPFEKVDTVVYQVNLQICGNTTDAELARIYAPDLSKSPAWTAIEQKRSIFLLNADLQDSISALSDILPDSIHPHTHYYQNKIKMQITGTIENDQRLILYERYDYKEKRYAIDKLCEFKDGKWEVNTLKISVN